MGKVKQRCSIKLLHPFMALISSITQLLERNMRLRTLRHYDIEWTMAQEQVDRTEMSMLRTLPVRSCSAGATATQI